MNRITRVHAAAILVVGVLGGAGRVQLLPPAALASYVGFLGGAVLGASLPDRESLLSDSVKVAIGASALFGVVVVAGTFAGMYSFGVAEFRAMAVVGPVVEPAMMVPVYFGEVFAGAFVVKRVQRWRTSRE